jgi:hypothetical protein
MYASLCLNGHPAIQAKYTYSTLLPAFLFGCVVYASATPPVLTTPAVLVAKFATGVVDTGGQP